MDFVKADPMSLLLKLRQYIYARTDVILRQVLKNSGWAASGQAVSAVAALGETVLLARFLSIETFGVFIVLASTTELIFGLLDFRTGEAVIKFVPELRQSQGNDAVSAFLRLVFIVDGAVAVVGFLIILFLGAVIARWLSIPPQYASLLIIIGSGSALRTMIRSVGSYLRVSDGFALSIKLGMVSVVSRLVMICIATVTAPKIMAISWAVALSDGAFFILMLLTARNSFRTFDVHPIHATAGLDKTARKSVLTFLLNTNMASTLRIVSTKLDVLVIAALTSTGVVALYKVAARIAGTLLLFSDPLLLAVYPEMSQLHAVNARLQLWKLLTFLTKSLALFAALVFFVFVCWGTQILHAFAGIQYAEAQPVVLLMLIGTSLAMIFFWARPLLLIYGMANQIVMIGMAAMITQYICLYLLVPRMGAQAAALAFTLNYLTSVALFIYLLLKISTLVRLNDGKVS